MFPVVLINKENHPDITERHVFVVVSVTISLHNAAQLLENAENWTDCDNVSIQNSCFKAPFKTTIC